MLSGRRGSDFQASGLSLELQKIIYDRNKGNLGFFEPALRSVPEDAELKTSQEEDLEESKINLLKIQLQGAEDKICRLEQEKLRIKQSYDNERIKLLGSVVGLGVRSKEYANTFEKIKKLQKEKVVATARVESELAGAIDAFENINSQLLKEMSKNATEKNSKNVISSQKP